MKKPTRSMNIAGWVVQAILSILFVLASLGKLTSAPGVVDMFRNWGLPDGFHLAIGGLELAGAIGLLVPRLAGYAALGLVAVMLGAAGTHLKAGEGLEVLRPGIFLVALLFVVWVRRPWPLRS